MSVKNQEKDQREQDKKKAKDLKNKKSTDLSVPKDEPSKSQAKGSIVENTKPEARNPSKGKGGKDKRQ